MGNGKAIGFADYTPQWRLHRKVAVSALKMYINGVSKQGNPGFIEEFNLLVNRLHSTNGRPHDVTKQENDLVKFSVGDKTRFFLNVLNSTR